MTAKRQIEGEFRLDWRALRLIMAAMPLLGCSAIVQARPADAEPNEAAPNEDAVDYDAPPEGSVLQNAQGQVFEPIYFDQFAPRNALDMVRRIPGFAISDGNQDQRGLGQADQNVIVNGERFSSKSDSVRDQLSRIPASDVVRVEIVDGNTLDIPGLSGQVANVVYASSGTTGQFTWRTSFRAHNTEAQLYGGEISITGSSGRLKYTVSLTNDNDRFGADGPVLITDADGVLIEEQFSKLSGKFDDPTLTTNFSYDFGNSTIANLNLSYGEDFFDRIDPERGVTPAGLVRERDASRGSVGPEYEIGGDIEFPLGPGSLKLIGLERFERDNFFSEVVDRFDDGSAPIGSRFERTSDEGERIGRFEYSWNMWAANWQLSGEAVFNRLDRRSRLFELAPDGSFSQLGFPEGTGGVSEDRYEGILSITRQLTSVLSLQLTGGAELSKIEQTGSAANSRSFQRPKGSLSLSWKPDNDFDVSVELRRDVGQLSFGDFLANVSLNTDNSRGGNNNLVPDQSWNLEIEVNKGLGDWGSIKLEARQAWFEDFIDFFPLADGGEARGNIGDARRTQLELNATFNGDPIGLGGTRLEVRAIQRWMSVTDPFTGRDRAFSNDLDNLLDVDFRHDIPGSDWAWGSGIFTEGRSRFSRRFELGRDFEGPTFMNAFVEHKDVLGTTMRAEVRNILGARNKFERVVFDGPRPNSPIRFSEVQDRRIGPIFRFEISGNF